MKVYSQLEFDKIKRRIEGYCYTVRAKSKVSLLSPLSEKKEIEDSLSSISECQEIRLKGYIFSFDFIVDLKKTLYHFKYRAFSYPEFYNIYQTVVKTLELIEFIKEEEQILEEAPHFLDLCDNLVPLPGIKSRFEEVFSADGGVLDSASPVLKQIRKRKSSLRKSILNCLDEKLKDHRLENVIQEKIITQREGRYVIPLKEGGLNTIPGIVHGYSGSKASIYVEPDDIVNQNNELHSLKKEEEDEIYRIFCQFTDAIMEDKDAVYTNNVTISELDYYFGCAKMGNELLAAKPRISPHYFLSINNARHPLLIYNYGAVDKVIPFNLTLGEKEKMLILSGPNTGGKTVTLKTVGLLTLMALSGLPIPAAEDSVVGMFDNIFCDISDEQSIENALSSFSSHIEKIKEMLGGGNRGSLILIDEIGSATDPEQGAALAQAILEKLIKLQVTGIVTTHYTPLKIFAEKSDKCLNAAMQFDPDMHCPTYQFKVGLPGNSFALETAERLGFDEEVLQRAKQLSGKKNVELTDLITSVSREKKELSQIKYRLELRNKLLEQKVNEYERMIDEMERQKKEIRLKTLAEQKDYLSSTQKELSRELEQVKKEDRKKRKEKVKKMFDEVADKQQHIAEEETSLTGNEYVPLKEVKNGEEVWVKDFAAAGKVVSHEKNKVTVDMDGILFTTGKESLYKIESGSGENTEKKAGRKHSGDRDSRVPGRSRTYSFPEVKTELKVLGLTFEEALPLVEKFVDEGYSSGLNSLRIVHGKGTGALRGKIRNYLKGLAIVSDFYSPSEDMGGDGVTVVKFS